jgi:menaquinone-dependent protoporphyrinogen oxidase
MKILVSAASKHGATAEIAKVIGETLEAAGHEAVVLPPDAVTSLAGYDAAVLGSSLYVGQWADAAKALVEMIEFQRLFDMQIKLMSTADQNAQISQRLLQAA